MAQWLKTVAVLSGDTHSVPSIHTRRLTTTGNSSSKASRALFWPPGGPPLTYAPQQTYSYTQNLKKKSK